MTTLVEYYQNLLLSQYQEQPKAMSTIAVLVENAICDLVLREIEAAFNLDMAIGSQLDVLGEYIGFGRSVRVLPTQAFFNMTDYDTPSETMVGMTDYADETENALSTFYRYSMASQGTADLNDEDYRLILQWKVKFNSLGSSLHDIAVALYESFGSNLICFDHKNMSISYAVREVSEKHTKILAQQYVLPKPMGVQLGGVFLIEDTSITFGFANYIGDNGTLGFSDYIVDPNPTVQYLEYTDKVI